jgi:GT2 family glycosyltransferase
MSQKSPTFNQNQQGHIDSVIDGVVKGWALSFSGTEQSKILFVFIDEKPIGNITCDLNRPDLELFGVPCDRAGFEWQIPVQYLDDKPHKISVRFSNGARLNFQDEAGKADANGITFQMGVPSGVRGFVDGMTNGAIRGWAIRTDFVTGKKSGVGEIIVTLGGDEIGRAKVDKFRADVAKSLDCDAYCGFSFIPPIRFRTGHAFTFSFNTSDGKELENSPLQISYPQQLSESRIARLFLEVEEIAARSWALKRELHDLMRVETIPLDAYDSWFTQYRKALRFRRKIGKSTLSEKTQEPLVSVICPVYRPRLTDFRAAVDSVLKQTYTNWELLLVDDKSDSADLSACLDEYEKHDKRIRVIRHKKNGHISVATNTAINAAKGAYIAFFDHDDLLEDLALEIMVEAALKTGAKLLYSDEDKIDDYGRFSDPNLKSDWNYRLMLGQNYVCHFVLVEAIALRQAGPLNSKYDGAQDHELLLRLSEIVSEKEIYHVPEVIYHWRKTPGSTASEISSKSYAINAGAAAIKDHLKRRGFDVTVSPLRETTMFRVGWQQTAEPKISIIIPFKDHIDTTKRCLESIMTFTAYGNFEVILVDNWSTTREAALFCIEATQYTKVRVIRVEEPFNYSRLNNFACAQTDAEFFVFMNNDVFVGQEDWLRNLVDEALVDIKVGAVGAMLLYPDTTVQHAGAILGIAGCVADHAYVHLPADTTGFMGRGLCAQELSAVTAALMLCRASYFNEVEGFDELDLAVAYNDVDLCLKLRRKGYRVVWTPTVVVEHHESLSRGDDMMGANLDRFIYEEQTMYSRWQERLATDPFYNKHFSRKGVAFAELSSVSLSINNDI